MRCSAACCQARQRQRRSVHVRGRSSVDFYLSWVCEWQYQVRRSVDRKSLSSHLSSFAGTLRRKQGPWIEKDFVKYKNQRITIMRNSNILKWGNNNKNNKLSLGLGSKNNTPDKSKIFYKHHESRIGEIGEWCFVVKSEIGFFWKFLLRIYFLKTQICNFPKISWKTLDLSTKNWKISGTSWFAFVCTYLSN